jgi:cytoskeleton protein RodZ
MTSPGIGERLRNAREARGLSLDEVEAGTRIRRRYLEALEAEAFAQIPGPAYVKGFVRTYATYLGFSPEDLASLSPEVAEEISISPAPAVEVRITPVTRRSSTRQILLGIGLVVVIGVALVGYILYGQVRQFATTRPSGPSVSHRPASTPARVPGAAGSLTPPSPPAPPLPSLGPVSPPRLPASPGAAAAPSSPAPSKPSERPPGGSPSPESPPPGPSQGTQRAPGGAIVFTGPLEVVAVATDRAWLRVVADGAVVFEGYMSAGMRQAWEARRQITLKVGNASGLDVSVNGQPLGPLGNPGDVVERTFTAGDSGNP